MGCRRTHHRIAILNSSDPRNAFALNHLAPRPTQQRQPSKQLHIGRTSNGWSNTSAVTRNATTVEFPAG
jgi:hypothetical protein